MTDFFECFNCKKVAPVVVPAACPLCGSTNGQTIESKAVEEGKKKGAFFNIDPATGKRKKQKRR